MRKLLYSAIALAFMAAPVYAEPVKMTTAQLDEVTAAGANKYRKNFHIKVGKINAAVNVVSSDKIDDSVINQIALALQDVNVSRGGKIILNLSQSGSVYQVTYK